MEFVTAKLLWLFNFTTAVIAIGLVILVHELGHFLMARWAGVYVERFSIGFGPKLFGFKRGDTEYTLCAIPLGGYVKMLGQSDSAEQPEQSDDERSYQNKSVFWRMGIISAGVVMNVIFAFLCFSLCYQIGVKHLPATVGYTTPGHPAWQAGVLPGDEFVEINEQPVDDFQMLMQEVAITKPGKENLTLKIKRGSDVLDRRISPMVDPNSKRSMLGVGTVASLTLLDGEPILPNSAAANPISGKFEPQDTVTAVNGKPVTSYGELQRVLFPLRKEEVTFTVKRHAEHKTEAGKTVDVKVAPHFVRTIGLQMQIGPIVAIQQDSPAANGVDEMGKPFPLKENDVITAVDGVAIEEIDPMRLPDIVSAKAGEPVKLTVSRPTGSEQDKLVITVKPNDRVPWSDTPVLGSLGNRGPFSIPSIGIAFRVLPRIRAIDPNGPAAKANSNIKPGDRVTKVVMTFQDDKGKQITEEYKEIGDDIWPAIFWTIQNTHVQSISLTVEHGNAPFNITLQPTPDPTWPLTERGLSHQGLLVVSKSNSVGDSISRGWQKTRYSIIRLYLVLRGLFSGFVPVTSFSGPLSIFGNATAIAGLDWVWLMEFIAILSINLAVINFLPIPILDGGHMVFLIYEMIFRRPPSERVMNFASWIGIAIILSLMVLAFGSDIYRMFFKT